MRTRLLATAVIAGLGLVAVPAHAAKAKPQITDPAGDANFSNDQGLGAPVDGQATPVDASAADITAVKFTSTFVKKHVHGKVVKKPTGFTVAMTLSAAPSDPEIFYRVSAAGAGCDDLFFEYGTDVATGGTAVRCPALPGADETDYTVPDAVVKGSTITWKIPASVIPVGTTFSSLNGQTRFNPAIVTAPQFDSASSTATFTIGK